MAGKGIKVANKARGGEAKPVSKISATSVASDTGKVSKKSGKIPVALPKVVAKPKVGKPKLPTGKQVAKNVRKGDSIAVLVDLDNTGASLDNLMEIFSVMQNKGTIAYAKIYGYSDDKVAIFEEFIAEHRLETCGRMRFKSDASVADTRLIVDAIRLATGGNFDMIFVWTGVSDLLPFFSMLKDKGVRTATVDNINYDSQNKFVDQKIRLFSPQVEPTKMRITSSLSPQTTVIARDDNLDSLNTGTRVEPPVVPVPKAAAIPMLDDFVAPVLPRKGGDISSKMEEPEPEEPEQEVSGDDVVLMLYEELKREREEEKAATNFEKDFASLTDPSDNRHSASELGEVDLSLVNIEEILGAKVSAPGSSIADQPLPAIEPALYEKKAGSEIVEKKETPEKTKNQKKQGASSVSDDFGGFDDLVDIADSSPDAYEPIGFKYSPEEAVPEAKASPAEEFMAASGDFAPPPEFK